MPSTPPTLGDKPQRSGPSSRGRGLVMTGAGHLGQSQKPHMHEDGHTGAHE